jgi:penicillin-binding protein 2
MRFKTPVEIYQGRLKFIRIVIIIFFCGLVIRYWQLQVMRGPEYFILSEQNRIRITTMPAPRGIVFDRNGIIIAKNRPAYNVVLYRYQLTENITEISKFLNLPQEYIKERLKKYSNVPISEPVVLKVDIPFEEVAMLEPRLIDHTNLDISVEPIRFYPLMDQFVHVLGYTGEISETEMGTGYFPGTMSGDLIGKTALEKKYDKYLRGEKGEITDVVDNLGRKVYNLLTKDPKAGKSLTLSIDSELQQKIFEIFGENVGAVVAMKPDTGEILAMVSKPSYNPNLIQGHFPEEKWKELLDAENDPLQNRAIQNTYSPGSMFKLVLALAALQEGKIDDDTTYNCTGISYFFRKPFRCNKASGHGKMNLYDAIRLSCNVFFYNTGNKIGIDIIAKYSKRFGFNFRTDIDLVEEKKGLIPDPEWKQYYFKEPWYAGETISVAIGQGAVQITLIQQASFISAIANGGKILQPFITKEIKEAGGKILYSAKPKVRGLLGITPENLEKVRMGMWGVVNDYGTGWGAKVFGKEVAGKTGTAQVIKKDVYGNQKDQPWEFRNHSWFSCYAPMENPEIVLVVLAEHAGDGSVVAAPIAGRILREYFKLQEQRTKEEAANEN